MNECLLALCISLFSGSGSEGYEAGAQVNFKSMYIKVQSLAGEVPVTQGFELNAGKLKAQIGFGSLFQHGVSNDTWGDMFLEVAGQYTFNNGIYGRVSSVAGISRLSGGLSVKWGE